MTDRILATTNKFIFPLLYSVSFVLLFTSAYQFMWRQWNSSDYNYCYFVPPIIGYLLWERSYVLCQPSKPSWIGLPIVIFGIFIYLLGELGGEYYSIYFSSWVILVGLLWLHFGWQKLKALAFPVCFLLAMFPFPNAVNNSLSLHLKLISSKLGVILLQLSGISVFQEGNIIDLGITKLEVVEACSGLRYLFPLIIVSLLLVVRQRSPWWQRCLVVCSAIPFSIAVNSVRITAIAWLYPYLGNTVVEGFGHDLIGWCLFMVSVGGMLTLQLLLLKIMPMPEPVTFSGHMVRTSILMPKNNSIWPLAMTAITLLATTTMATHSIDFREQTPLARPLAEFPLAFNDWQGKRSNLDQSYLDALKLSDYLLIDYSNAQGQTVGLYVAYNSSQRKGASSHSPSTCLPGSGWFFQNSGTIDLPIGAQASMATVKQAFMKKNGERLLAYYWFPQRGRILTNLIQLKWYTFWDALTKQRTDGALVRLITPVRAGEQPTEAEKRLQDFSRLIEPQLNTFLPGR